MKMSKYAWSVATVAIALVLVSCGSSANTTTTVSTTRGATSATSASTAATGTTPATTAKAATTTATSTSGGANKAQLTLSGDVNGAFTADATAPVTCTQTPTKIVLSGAAGGHRGTITITAITAGGNIDVAYLPDGVGGAQYLASHIPPAGGDSRGFVTLNADESGKLDIVVPYVAGSAGSFNGSSTHVIGTWTC